MKLATGCALLAVVALAASANARKQKSGHASPTKPQPNPIEAATRLQVFLDRANFGPGIITGCYNDFTFKALSYYRQSRGEPQPSPPAKPDAPPSVDGIDFGNVGPTFIDYTVVDTDFQSIGPVPSGVPAQAKVKSLPYRDAAEAIAEKFHCDVRFLGELNPGKTKSIKAGDHLKVPNVEPFDLGSVKELKPGSDIDAPAANELPEENQTPNDQTPPAIAVKIDTKTNMLGVFDADKLVAAYPVTLGSGKTQSPIGEWKVQRIEKMPRFRWDEAMLQHGQRSGNFHMLPPGPNSPVGVIWIALNKKGIGIHGTKEPETIGHAASHGCVRLTNWDVVRLAQKVKPGVPVSIH
ncbi:MAG TPA: L,D-transpeptidase [Chthoniobacterales bacterium]